MSVFAFLAIPLFPTETVGDNGLTARNIVVELGAVVCVVDISDDASFERVAPIW